MERAVLCCAVLLHRFIPHFKPGAVQCSLQGHFQIIMNRKYCPLFRSRLDWLSRMLYCSGVWSYVINAFTTPIFMAVPIITIWVGEQQLPSVCCLLTAAHPLRHPDAAP
jgi:hypothetical protein